MGNIYHQDLLDQIDAFLAKTGMGQSYFGKKASGNSEIVKRLRNGGQVLPKTEHNIRSFIAEHSPVEPPKSEAV